jgi:hypothetical protein
MKEANLPAADVRECTCSYDQDFNPQMDIQAISRAHRIGQTKPVSLLRSRPCLSALRSKLTPTFPAGASLQAAREGYLRRKDSERWAEEAWSG